MDKKNLLWLSYLVPYDCVPHAGGKIHNYYLKEVNKTNKYNIKLITCAKENELPKIDLDKYNIDYSLYIQHSSKIKNIIEKIDRWSFWTKKSGFTSRYKRDYFIKSLIELKNIGYQPDIIVLQWTQVVLIEPDIKAIFPTAPVICIEEDVSYLSYYRRYKYEKNILIKPIRKFMYSQLMKLEIACLKQADLVVLNNFKDDNLIKKEGINNTWVWTPFFQNFREIEYTGERDELLFYGAMYRYENWKSVIWFVDNVLPYLDNKKVKLVVVGGNPHNELLNLRNPRVDITGYVDDVSEYFAHSKCLVAPLVLGAGVKIKVLESMSAGLPVLTNDIGIEGIAANDGVEYFHCETPSDYIETLNKILSNQIDVQNISRNSKLFISEKYDINKSLNGFVMYLDKLTTKG